MWITLLIVSAVILLCVLAEKFSDKFGMPALIAFMFIGMIFGSDGLFKIPFEDFAAAETICSIALIFIMFYGGFNTKWSAARSVAPKAVMMATAGVVGTALVTTGLCMLLLDMSFIESFLIGSVLSSTDAASVFAILRKYKLSLRDGTASLLEVESGSNDPFAYMLTVIAILIYTTGSTGNIFFLLAEQIVFGLALGLIFAEATRRLLEHTRLVSDGLETIFIIAMVLLCYALTSGIGGNAYLAVYIYGILLGNRHIRKKSELVAFFDGVTSLSQILIFFLIGLLTFPSRMPSIISEALVIVAILTFVSRPLTTFLILKPMKCSTQQCLLVAWAGLRGASSTVFSIMAVASGVAMTHDLFHIVFLVSLFSVSIQGTLLPKVAQKLDMVDPSLDVRKTFNDYQDEVGFQLIKVHIHSEHRWAHWKIRDIIFPPDTMAVMLKRGGERIITKGDTDIRSGDDLILSVPQYVAGDDDQLVERYLEKEDPWCGKMIYQLGLKENTLIVMVIRNGEKILPDGSTLLMRGDTIVLFGEIDD